MTLVCCHHGIGVFGLAQSVLSEGRLCFLSPQDSQATITDSDVL